MTASRDAAGVRDELFTRTLPGMCTRNGSLGKPVRGLPRELRIGACLALRGGDCTVCSARYSVTNIGGDRS